MTKPFGRYESGNEPAKPVEPLSTQCTAYGCPLPGVFSPQLRGRSFYCRAHEGISAEHWPLVTERVRRNEKAMLVAIDLANSVSGGAPEDRFVYAFVKRYGEVYARRSRPYGMMGQKIKVRGSQPETAREYGHRVYLLLLDLVRADVSREAPVNLKEVTEAWKPLQVAA